MLAANAGRSAANPSLRGPEQGLVVVTNRLIASRGSALQANIDDPERLVHNLLHELAAHAGLLVRGETTESEHGTEGKVTKADIVATQVRGAFKLGPLEVSYHAQAELAAASRLHTRLTTRPIHEVTKEAHQLAAKTRQATEQLRALQTRVEALVKTLQR